MTVLLARFRERERESGGWEKVVEREGEESVRWKERE
jgi:hypothetical protein